MRIAVAFLLLAVAFSLSADTPLPLLNDLAGDMIWNLRVSEDLVVWHTFGPTHFPRVEDWPVMPVDYAKFTLKPYGFFDRNPALNVPSSESIGMACHADVAGPGAHDAASACDCASGACTCSGHAH